VLSRGYSLTRTPEGRLIQDATAVRPGDAVRTRLARGELVSRVEQVLPAEEST
jgi:exodeoxyribonuclease VII large subunit